MRTVVFAIMFLGLTSPAWAVCDVGDDGQLICWPDSTTDPTGLICIDNPNGTTVCY